MNNEQNTFLDMVNVFASYLWLYDFHWIRYILALLRESRFQTEVYKSDARNTVEWFPVFLNNGFQVLVLM